MENQFWFANSRKDLCAICTAHVADLSSAIMKINLFDFVKTKKQSLAICFDSQNKLPLEVTNIGDEY